MSQVTSEIQVDGFIEKIFEDFARTMGSFFVVIGDELGLFKALYHTGRTDVEGFAKFTGLNQRYVAEWLKGSVAAGYIEYDAESDEYFISEAAYQVLGNEDGEYFLQGLFNQMFPLWFVLDDVIDAFKNGGGVPYEKYDERWWRGIERETAVTFKYALPGYIEQMTEIHAKLQDGGKVADIGSGRGRAMIELAKLYPNSVFHGYDAHDESINASNESAISIGVEENTAFSILNLTDHDFPEQYDLITAFDVVHDLEDPETVIKRAYSALHDGGVLFIRDFNPRREQEQNVGLFPTALYGFSMMYCMTTSLHRMNKGVGTMGLQSEILEDIALQAGFSKFEILFTEEDDWVIGYKITK